MNDAAEKSAAFLAWRTAASVSRATRDALGAIAVTASQPWTAFCRPRNHLRAYPDTH